jgi:hypothetical protein
MATELTPAATTSPRLSLSVHVWLMLLTLKSLSPGVIAQSLLPQAAYIAPNPTPRSPGMLATPARLGRVWRPNGDGQFLHPTDDWAWFLGFSLVSVIASATKLLREEVGHSLHRAHTNLRVRVK